MALSREPLASLACSFFLSMYQALSSKIPNIFYRFTSLSSAVNPPISSRKAAEFDNRAGPWMLYKSSFVSYPIWVVFSSVAHGTLFSVLPIWGRFAYCCLLNLARYCSFYRQVTVD
ncbi:hypothetical protein ASPBRDRAFT_389621 [Aspergillus brasiliensis CBS 101740]|uniref:Uncharacterized protein n=1 Tax=Aspergillus brasiliensis (strain CBS 101740 / IMI 381727 / IBT 21946) TaxID=767769 RepID=A0A1L9UWD2_ASPBC|nr:hypothetical protein ASPBRDRAFT_389621 [Aspergillus brasiliensis CBS 101740]